MQPYFSPSLKLDRHIYPSHVLPPKKAATRGEQKIAQCSDQTDAALTDPLLLLDILGMA